MTSGVVPRLSLTTPRQGLACGFALGSAFGASVVLFYYASRTSFRNIIRYSKPDTATSSSTEINGSLPGTPQKLPTQSLIEGPPSKMVLLVRSDLKMEANQAPMVCLKVRDEEELLVYQEKAKLKGLLTSCVVDGNPTTHVAHGTRTVVAIGPGDHTGVTELIKDLTLL